MGLISFLAAIGYFLPYYLAKSWKNKGLSVLAAFLGILFSFGAPYLMA
ncbi:MAG: hypothetical protein JKY17_08980 [Magnetovibrio sp.]|nr:hypothetical protein [Magnetovibrio sp.]